MKNLIVLEYIKPIMESKEKLVALMKQYPDKRYSSELLLKVKNIETDSIIIKIHSTNNIMSDDCLLTMEEGKAFLRFYDTLLQLIEQIESEQKDIQSYNKILTSKMEEFEKRIQALKKKIHSIYYYSKEFIEAFHFVNSLILQPLTKKNVPTENLQEALSDVEKNIIKIEQIYQKENENVEERYQHNKKLTDNMTNKLETVCQTGSDVKYSNKVALMIDEIRRLISAYDRSGAELNVRTHRGGDREAFKGKKNRTEQYFEYNLDV